MVPGLCLSVQCFSGMVPVLCPGVQCFFVEGADGVYDFLYIHVGGIYQYGVFGLAQGADFPVHVLAVSFFDVFSWPIMVLFGFSMLDAFAATLYIANAKLNHTPGDLIYNRSRY